MTHITIKRFLMLQVFIMALSVLISNTTVQAVELPDKTPIQSYVEAMQPGWNLGNTYDATGKDETSWGNPVVTKELIDAVAASGFKSIRIPVTWNQRLGAAPDYKIDSSFLEKVKQTIDWSLDAGLYVMLNLHHDTSWIMQMEAQHDETIEKYKAIWTQLSSYFGGYTDKLMFESINEPRFSDDWNKDSEIYFEMVNELNMAFYNIVRNSSEENKTRPIVLPTLTCSPTQARIDNLVDTIAKLNDPNIIATIHYYGYWQFSVNIAGETMFGKNSISDVNTAFDRAYSTFVEKGVPVVIGEYGLLGFDRATDVIIHSEVLKYFAYVGSYAQEKGMTVMLWDNGQHFDRNKFKWRDESMYKTIMQSVQSKVAQADTEYIYVKANTDTKDMEVLLTLNDDELTAVENNGEMLTAEADYTVQGDKLIIYKSYIDNILQKDYSTKTKLTCRFKNSPDWDIFVNYYDSPILGDGAKSGKSFEIKTEFNGNKLITMEAKYKNGKGAGNQDWTTYKEFQADFYPDYNSGIIVLTDTFLRSINDAEVTLTMHFLSGETATYHIIKKGGNVTGGNTVEKAAVSEEVKPDDSNKSDYGNTKAQEQPSKLNNVSQNETSATGKLPIVAIIILIPVAVGVLVFICVITKNKRM